MKTNVGFSLSGKVPHCECGEQGSSPGVNQGNNEQGMLNKKVQSESELEINAVWCIGNMIIFLSF
jgi:hypothetical protein